MRDEYDDRLYQALRHDFAANLSDIAKSVAHAFDRLHERLYGAPWSDQSDPNHRASRLTLL
jgi:hypothetical protein